MQKDLLELNKLLRAPRKTVFNKVVVCISFEQLCKRCLFIKLQYLCKNYQNLEGLGENLLNFCMHPLGFVENK